MKAYTAEDIRAAYELGYADRAKEVSPFRGLTHQHADKWLDDKMEDARAKRNEMGNRIAQDSTNLAKAWYKT